MTMPGFGRGAVARILAFCVFASAMVLPAMAHPHIFIDAKVSVVFDDSGAIVGLKHDWTFDEAFSSWVVQGLDSNGDREISPEELQPLADDNLHGLADYGFYTYAGAQDHPLRFSPDGDQRMVYAQGRVTLSYGLSVLDPQPLTNRFELGIYDPEYYVAITIADPSAVVLENAPAGCRVTLKPPKEMDAALQNRLFALGPDVVDLPPDLAAAMRGTQGMIVITCDGAPPLASGTALAAANQMAAAHPPTLPFGGPPKEPGLNLPRSGIFLWLQTQQREFYQALNGTLASLKTDWTAFWLLGGLSFVYGIIHAAGPGHGKVVISAYMLANETQLRRGVALSVIAALVQSAVAVAFVLIAAAILGMTSMAMDVAASWISILSYALIAVLGLWLIWRKLFNGGHEHHHEQGNMAAKAHGHLHDGQSQHEHEHKHEHLHEHEHDHLHVVPPTAAMGNWREQLGVVLAVGLRPCSGALVVLVFALSQNLLPAGIAAVFLMGAGTAITVATLASIAVTAKGLARRIGGADNAMIGALVWWAELAGAFMVLALGIVLVIASF